MNLSKNLQLAIVAAKKAQTVITQGYGKIKTVVIKENKGIVTDIDREAERVIIETLKNNSNYSFLSEESGSQTRASEIRWIIDLLDGTTNFSRKIPQFAVTIALMKSQDILLGVTFNPITNECFYAEKNKGAFLNDQKIAVSDRLELKDNVLFINHGYGQLGRENYVKTVARFQACYLRTFGSTALELCYVACGSAEAFLSSHDELWDYAAGIILVKEAGGRVTDWQNKEWDNSSSYILASNGLVHDDILEKTGYLQ